MEKNSKINIEERKNLIEDQFQNQTILEQQQIESIQRKTEIESSQGSSQFVINQQKNSQIIYQQNKSSCQRCMTSIGNFISKCIPKSKYKLAFQFNGNHFFTSRYITILSILIFIYLIQNSIRTLRNVGTIQMILKQTVTQRDNSYLKDNFTEISLLPFAEYDVKSDQSFTKSLRLPFYSVVEFVSPIDCDSYYKLSIDQRIEYGYFQFYLYDSHDKQQLLKIPFSCLKFQIGYLYIDNLIGDIIKKFSDQEYVNGQPKEGFVSLSQEQNATIQKEYGLIIPNDINKAAKQVYYFSNFYKFCTSVNDSKEFQFQTSKNLINSEYKFHQEKDNSNLFVKTQILIQQPPKQYDGQEVCMKKKSYQKTYFQKQIIVYPESNLESLFRMFSSKKSNIYYDYEIDQKHLGYFSNDTDVIEFENEGYQTRENIYFKNLDDYELMTKSDIQTETLQKALSQIGGYVSLIFNIYGFLLAFVFPQIFYRRMSQYFNDNYSNYQDQLINPNEKRYSLKEWKDYLKKVFSYERFFEISKAIDEYQSKIEILESQNQELFQKIDSLNKQVENIDLLKHQYETKFNDLDLSQNLLKKENENLQQQINMITQILHSKK